MITSYLEVVKAVFFSNALGYAMFSAVQPLLGKKTALTTSR
jgi:hypothetical protein